MESPAQPTDEAMARLSFAGLSDHNPKSALGLGRDQAPTAQLTVLRGLLWRIRAGPEFKPRAPLARVTGMDEVGGQLVLCCAPPSSQCPNPVSGVLLWGVYKGLHLHPEEPHER